MRRLIIFLVRKRLGLKKLEGFQFAEQKSDAIYFFTDEAVMKWDGTTTKPSSVSLNWLLNDYCKIRSVEWHGNNN